MRASPGLWRFVFLMLMFFACRYGKTKTMQAQCSVTIIFLLFHLKSNFKHWNRISLIFGAKGPSKHNNSMIKVDLINLSTRFRVYWKWQSNHFYLVVVDVCHFKFVFRCINNKVKSLIYRKKISIDFIICQVMEGIYQQVSSKMVTINLVFAAVILIQ